MKAFLPDRRLPIAGWRVERGHWRIGKSRGGNKERDLRYLRETGEVGWGERWEDEEWTMFWRRCLTRQGTGCGVGGPRTAHQAENSISGILIRKLTAVNLALNDPHTTQHPTEFTPPWIYPFSFAARNMNTPREAHEPPGFQWSSAGKFYVISGTIIIDCLQPEPATPR